MTQPLDGTLHQALGELLQRQVELLAALQDVLGREAAVLASEGPEEVAGLADEKQRLGMRLSDLARELEGMLQGSPYAADGQGLARLVAEAPNATGLSRLHEDAIQSLRGCLAGNRSVGALVERRRCAVERALRIFFDAPEGTNLYQATGRLHSPAASNHLIGEA